MGAPVMAFCRMTTRRSTREPVLNPDAHRPDATLASGRPVWQPAASGLVLINSTKASTNWGWADLRAACSTIGCTLPATELALKHVGCRAECSPSRRLAASADVIKLASVVAAIRQISCGGCREECRCRHGSFCNAGKAQEAVDA
jgi:hypothetical protein